MSETTNKPLQAKFKRPVPPWMEPVLDSVRELLALPPNWNSYGSLQVSVDSVAAAIDVLNLLMRQETMPPAVVPTASGGLQLEWHDRGVDVEIYVSPSGQCTVDAEDISGQSRFEGAFTTSIPYLERVLGRLARSNVQ